MKRNIPVFLIIFVFLFTLTSCSAVKRIAGGGGKDKEQSLNEGPPQQMLNMEKDLEKLADKVEGQVLKTPEEQSGQQPKNQSGGSKDQSSGGKIGADGEKGTSGKQQSEEQPQQAPQQNPNDISEMLPDLEKGIGNLHKTWNGSQPELLKRGADKKVIDVASEALNEATTTLDSKNGLAFLKALNGFYRYMPELEEKMEPQTPPGLMRLTYYARDILYSTFSNETQTANDDMDMIQEEWAAVKPQLKKGGEDEINRMEVSIDELKNSLDEQNKNLIKIKADIVLDDIRTLKAKQKK